MCSLTSGSVKGHKDMLCCFLKQKQANFKYQILPDGGNSGLKGFPSVQGIMRFYSDDECHVSVLFVTFLFHLRRWETFKWHCPTADTL